MGGPEFAALLLPDVQELLTNGAVRTNKYKILSYICPQSYNANIEI